jgi:hypothetical protein
MTNQTITNGSTYSTVYAGPGDTLTNGGTITGSLGVVLTGPDSDLTNTATGLISAYSATDDNTNENGGFDTIGVGITVNGTATIVNQGSIYGNHVGIVLQAAGTAAPDASYIDNSGMISTERDNGVYGSGDTGDGIYLASTGGGTVVNSGTILAPAQDVFAYTKNSETASVTVINSGYLDATAQPFTIAGFAGYTFVSTAIFALGSGLVENEAGGTISAAGGIGIGLDAIYISYAKDIDAPTSGTIDNHGVVDANEGIYFRGLGGVQNAGMVAGGVYGVAIGNQSAYVVNTGTISASATATNAQGTVVPGEGVRDGGGTITNAATGTITGGNGIYGIGNPIIVNAGLVEGTQNGIFIDPAASATITNSGTILGNQSDYGAGIDAISGAASILNTGLISGYYGIEIGGSVASTIINAGTIVGSVTFKNDGGGRLVVDPGAVFTGSIAGAGAGAGTVLEFATGNGVIPAKGPSFSGFDTISFDAGAAWSVSGSVYGFVGNSIYGVQSTGAGTEAITGFGLGDTIVIQGIAASAGTYEAGVGLTLNNTAQQSRYPADLTVGFAGTFGASDFAVATDGTDTTISLDQINAPQIVAGADETIGVGVTVANPTLAGGVLTLASGGSITGDIDFTYTGTTASSTLVIADPGAGGLVIPNTITGFVAGDTIVLGGVPFDSAQDSYTVATAGTLTIDAAGSFYTLDIAGAVVGDTDFVLANDLGITTTMPCYAAGTRIETARGAVAVEDIAVGDMIVMARPGGPAHRPVVWTGRRLLDLTRHPAREEVLPVRIIAGAFGPGLPARDLRLSPHHAVFVDGYLFEALSLVNGATVRQERATTQVTYHHIELDTHDVILAEGLAAESFLNLGHRAMFEGEGIMQLHPDFRSPPDAKFCVPVIRAGAALAALRSRLLARAQALGFAPAAPRALDVRVQGRRLKPLSPGLYALPAGCRAVALHSPVGFAGQTGPVMTDRRPLGVALGSVTLTAGRKIYDIDLSHGHSGLYQTEAGATWTDGAAQLVLPAFTGTALIKINLVAQIEHWVLSADARLTA